MPSWLSSLWDFIKNPDDRTVIAWLCGGLVVAAGGIWKAITFIADREKDSEKKSGGTIVSLTGQKAASGRDTTYQGPVNIGPSPEHIDQFLRPLTTQLAAKDAQIADLKNLTKSLLEKNASTAAPGAEQAVGKAVQSIGRGAGEGDPRLQQAFALLKENKITEAEPLLSAFAEDKEARAEQSDARAEQETARAKQDRKEAAIAYRNLGAIAGLRDPKAAREAYAKGANEHQIFWARTGLGDIAVARGDLNATLSAYDEAHTAMERLAASDAGNANWQRDQSVSNERLGDILLAQGNHPAALEQYRASLDRMVPIRDHDPSNADLQRFTSVTFYKIGDVLVEQGNLADALSRGP